MKTPPDRTRAMALLAGVGGLTAAWAALAQTNLSEVSWLAFVAACLLVVAAPTVAKAPDRAHVLRIAGQDAAMIALVAVVSAILLPSLSGLAVMVAFLAAAGAVGVAFIVMPTQVTQPTLLATPTKLPAKMDQTLQGDVGEGSFESGHRLGRYTLEARIAVGGMGEVWRARHETLIRPAVLKIIRKPAGKDADRALSKELMERFRREAMVTANLTSPHTVHLYDFGVDGDGSLYIAMELLEAVSLSLIVHRFGPMEEERVAFLLRQACHSLVEAHDKGVVHRDLKPDNLLVTRAGRDLDFLKVIDFGLAKFQHRDGGADARRARPPAENLTAIGARPGTPGYMAPEQIGGAGIDQRADIYALACVAYFALTGQPVFEGTEEAQLMFAHMQIEPDPPSERAGRPIHAGLEAVIMRCLAKNPLARPQSMKALDDQLAALTFASPWTQDRAQSWWSEERMQLRTRARESV